MGRTAPVGDNGEVLNTGFRPMEAHLAQEGSGVKDDQLNVPLEDAELLAEVELTTNLIIAASEADTPLAQAEVDRLLGVAGDDDGLGPNPIPIQKTRHSA